MELYANVAVLAAVLLGVWLICELKHRKKPTAIVKVTTIGVVIMRFLDYIGLYVLKLNTSTIYNATTLSLVAAGWACFTYMMSIIILYFTNNDCEDRHDNDIFS